MSATSPLALARTFASPGRVEATPSLLRQADARRGAPPALGTLANAQAGLTPLPTAAPHQDGGRGALAVPAPRSAVPQSALRTADPAEVPVRIGLLGRALAAALSSDATATTTPVTLPPLDAAVSAPEQFAPALARAVAQSGLSYEAHLRDWVEGTRTLEQVRNEARAQGPAASAAASGSAAPAAPAAVAGALAHATVAESGAVPAATPPVTHVPAPSGASVPDPATSLTAAQQITATQLRCIESGDLRFAFQAWPGQTCAMILRPHEQRSHGQDHAAQTAQGDSTLTLQMPHLGQVQARLRTHGHEVQLSLQTGSTEAARQLNAASATLSSSLGLAGLRLLSVVVHEPV